MPATPITSTALPADHERLAVQAYLRLLHTVRAAFDEPATETGTGSRTGTAGDVPPPMLPPAAPAEADRALRAAGLTGNEREFFTLLRDWCTAP
jgi:hypothetical protein